MHAWRVPLVLATAATVLLTGCTSAAGNHGTAGAAVHAMKTVSLGDRDTVRVPTAWSVTKFRGEPATVYLPILFMSSRPLAPECGPGARTERSCQRQNWFSPHWRTPDDGVLLMWALSEIPADGLRVVNANGRPAVIAHHSARISAGSAFDCLPGTSRTVHATVRAWGRNYPYELLDMIACFGPHAPDSDRTAVMAMLRSLRVRSTN